MPGDEALSERDVRLLAAYLILVKPRPGEHVREYMARAARELDALGAGAERGRAGRA